MRRKTPATQSQFRIEACTCYCATDDSDANANHAVVASADNAVEAPPPPPAKIGGGRMNHSNRARRGIAPLPFAAWLASLALLIVSSFAVPNIARAQGNCVTATGTQVRVCNLNQADAASTFNLANGQHVANAFTVGDADLGYSLITLRLDLTKIPTNQQDTFNVSIYDNTGTGGGPGTSLGRMVHNNSNMFATGVQDFNAPASGIALAKGGTFWLVITRGAGDSVTLATTDETGENFASTDWSIGDAARFGNSFAELAETTGIVKFSVLATPVTPPSCPTTSGTQQTVCNLDGGAASVLTSAGTTIAQAFTVGGTGSYGLNSVRLRLENVSSGVTLTLAIHAQASGGSVGDALDGTLACPALAVGVIDCRASGFALTGGATYYVVPTVTASVLFAATSSEDEDGDTGWEIGQRRFGRADGTWSDFRTPVLRMGIVATPGAAGPALPVLTIAKVADATEGEDDSIDFTVTPSRAFTAAQTVTVTLASDPAADLDPYIASGSRTGMVAFVSGNDMDDAKTVTFAITDDEIDNGGVEVTATIAANHAAYHISAGSVATAQIDDDDGNTLPRVTLGSGSDVFEGAESGVVFTVQPSRAFAARQVITVTVSGSIDFLTDSSPMTVTYEVGETQEKSVTYPLRADDCIETGGGIITASITPDPAFTVSGTGDVAINDGSAGAPPVLTIAADSATVTEGTDATIDFTITPSASFCGAQQQITVTLTGADDYVAAASRTQTATFAAGRTAAQTVSFPLPNDCVDNGGSTITASITPDPAFTVSGTSEVRINDAGDAPGCIPTLSPALRLKLRVFLESALP